MKVLYINSIYSEIEYGRNARFHDMMRNITKVGIEPVIIANKYIKNDEITPKFDVYEVNWLTNNPRMKLEGLIKLRRIIKELVKEIDVIHFVGQPSSFFPYRIVRHYTDKPVVAGVNFVSLHPPWRLHEVPEYGKNFFVALAYYIRDIFLFHTQKFDLRVILGNYDYEFIKKYYLFDKSAKIRITMPATDLNIFNPEIKPAVEFKDLDLSMLHITVSRAKGFPYLYKATKYLPKDLKWKCIVVGLDEMGFFKKREIGNFIYYGPIVRNKMAAFYNSVDVSIQPSIWEASPLILVESLACGTPVIGSDIEAHRELIKPGINGYLFRNRDPKMLAEKILKFLDNKDQIKRETIKQYKRYDIIKELRKLKKWYIELLEGSL